MAKPKQKFEVNFQKDICEQLDTMTKQQLVRLFFTVSKLLPISFPLMTEFREEFIFLFKSLGRALAEGIRGRVRESPNMANMAEVSANIAIENENPFLHAMFSGLGGESFDKKLAGNIIEALIRIVDPGYEGIIGWRDSIVTYVRTHSKTTATMLRHIGAHPTYRQIIHFLNKLNPHFEKVRNGEDVITTFDNEQKLKKSYRLGGEEGSNKSNLYPHIKTNIQFKQSLSPAKWLWNKLPKISEHSKTFSQVLQTHKEQWWNKLLKEIFSSEEPSSKKVKYDDASKRVANRRELYDFAEAKHPTNPAEIEVGKPHDLNPASYEDTKKIIREESIIAGISKYGSGERSWFAFVCDGSPFKNFLSLFNVLFFCNLCKKPCGEMKKHVKENRFDSNGI